MKKKSIGHERLEQLASFLYRVPSASFDMTRWIQRTGGTLSLDEHKCNTAGCAIGWATVRFAADGFHLRPDRSMSGIPMPKWEEFDGWKAVREFFDLPEGAEAALFANIPETADLGPRQVAKLIRKYLKTGKFICPSHL